MGAKHHSVKVTLAESGGSILKRSKRTSPHKSSNTGAGAGVSSSGDLSASNNSSDGGFVYNAAGESLTQLNGRKERQILRPVPSVAPNQQQSKLAAKEDNVSLDEKAFVSQLHKMQINDMMTRTQVRSAQLVRKKDSHGVAMVFFADTERNKEISKWELHKHQTNGIFV